MIAMLKKPVSPSHGACTLAFPCDSNSPSDGEPGGRPKPRKSSAVRSHHRRRQNERQKSHGRDHGIWQQMPENNDRIRHPESARRLDIFEIAAAQKFRADQTDQRHPGKQKQYPEQDEEPRHKNRRNDQQQIERWDGSPYLDEALEQKIGPTPEVALNGAGSDADDRGYDGERQAEQHRNAESVNQPRQHIAAAVVGAEPVRSSSSHLAKPWLAANSQSFFVNIHVGLDGNGDGGLLTWVL